MVRGVAPTSKLPRSRNTRQPVLPRGPSERWLPRPRPSQNLNPLRRDPSRLNRQTLHRGKALCSVASADADKRAPYRRKRGGDQNVDWIVAERTAVSAHHNAKTADFIMAGG